MLSIQRGLRKLYLRKLYVLLVILHKLTVVGDYAA